MRQERQVGRLVAPVQVIPYRFGVPFAGVVTIAHDVPDDSELTPKRLTRFREDLEHAGVGQATVLRCMRIVQSILSFAITEELVEFNAMAAVRKPRYERAREPRIFLPGEVEQIRANLKPLRDRTLVSVLAYSGPRPEEVVCRLIWDDIGQRAIGYRDTKRHRVRFTPLLAPLAEDLREWFLASGRPANKTPVFPAHDGKFWDKHDWANWRRRISQGRAAEPATNRNPGRAAQPGAAPAGTRPRHLRSSYVTLRVYEGIPLTTISREVGTSVLMIERHYAGVIENWDGHRVPAEAQIRPRVQPMDAEWTCWRFEGRLSMTEKPCKSRSGRSRTRTWDLFLIREAL